MNPSPEKIDNLKKAIANQKALAQKAVELSKSGASKPLTPTASKLTRVEVEEQLKRIITDGHAILAFRIIQEAIIRQIETKP